MASSRYIPHGLNSTDNQPEKVIRTSQNKQGVVVRITKDNLNGNSHKIPLTKTQINRITKARNGLNLSLSSSQLEYLRTSGGLPPLLALLFDRTTVRSNIRTRSSNRSAFEICDIDDNISLKR